MRFIRNRYSIISLIKRLVKDQSLGGTHDMIRYETSVSENILSTVLVAESKIALNCTGVTPALATKKVLGAHPS